LLKNIDDESIDFIRKCLVIDGSVRCKTSELLNHPFFDKEFRDNFESKLQMMQEEDVLEEKRLM
jgi:serine/threonine protein kinase